MKLKHRNQGQVVVGLSAKSSVEPLPGSVVEKCRVCGSHVIVSGKLMDALGKVDVWCHVCFVKSRVALHADVRRHPVVDEELEEMGVPEQTIEAVFEAFLDAARRGLH